MKLVDTPPGPRGPDPAIAAFATANELGLRIAPGELPAVCDRAIGALAEDAGNSDVAGTVYSRGGRLVRVVYVGGKRNGILRAPAAPEIIEVDEHHIADRLARIVPILRFDKRANDWRPADLPERVARMIVARREYPTLPELVGVLEAPTITPDRGVLQVPGYDWNSGLLLHFPPGTFPPVPDNPTKREAAAALKALLGIISGFAFASLGATAAALALILTALVRAAVPAAPLFLVTAPAPGSGKTLLARVVGIIAVGRDPAVTIIDGDDPSEFAKRLFALLFAGDQIIVLDNVEGELSSPDLCAALTAPVFQSRVLGASEMRKVPSAATWIATGNNVRPRGDLTRRVLEIRLDTHLERPADRRYPFDPIEAARARRGELVAAALTIVRYGARATRRSGNRARLPSFEEWDDLVRSPLLALGAGDPCEGMRTLEDTDPERQQARALFSAWQAALSEEVYSVAEVIAQAYRLARRGPAQRELDVEPRVETRAADGRLLDALLDVAQRGGELNRKVLGKWLARYDGRIEVGLELKRMGDRSGVATWQLKAIKVV